MLSKHFIKDKNCLGTGASITFCLTREKQLLPYFCQQEEFDCGKDIGFLLKIGLSQYRAEEWRLFIDSSERSLKCVLVHNSNRCVPLPLGHSTKLTEEYNIKTVLQKLDYDFHEWISCVDLQRVIFLIGQQSGCAISSFIYLWDSRACKWSLGGKGWPPEDSMRVVETNFINEPKEKIIQRRKNIIIPPVHIKLGLMKPFVKNLHATEDCINYICRAFLLRPLKSWQQAFVMSLKSGNWKDSCFFQSMTDAESAAWQ